MWVNAVDAGSPASSLGLQPGDIITQMAGKDVASDGTMKDYCDVLRTKGQDAAIGVEVLRFDTSEVLRGEFNGKELVQAFSFADELGTSDDAATETYDSFSIVTDDSNTIQVEVPDEWSDVRGGAQDIAGVQAPSIQASPNVDDFLNTFDVPGMEFVLSDQFTPDDFETILDAVGPSELLHQQRARGLLRSDLHRSLRGLDGLPGHRRAVHRRRRFRGRLDRCRDRHRAGHRRS